MGNLSTTSFYFPTSLLLCFVVLALLLFVCLLADFLDTNLHQQKLIENLPIFKKDIQEINNYDGC